MSARSKLQSRGGGEHMRLLALSTTDSAKEASMAARLAVLAFAALSLAACETASTDDTAVHRGASPTLGDLGHHQRGMVRGPVVADAAPARATTHHAAAHPAAARATTTATAARGSGTRTASVVPNPMRAPRAATTAPATTDATATAAQPSTQPTEPAQPASVTAQSETPAAPVAPTSETQSTIGAYPSGGDASTVPVSEQPIQPTPPIEFGIGDLTPDKISAMFGGMPFLLIASIAAALVAALGLALRPSKPAKEQDPEYNGPHVVDYDEDHREPYAA
jgi:hypothetical protein